MVNDTGQTRFWQCALESGLLSREQLHDARVGVCWPEIYNPEAGVTHTDDELANWLVETGALNQWQAKQLLEGRIRFRLGPYIILDSIGQGAMGHVYQARHEKLGSTVALKVLPPERATPEAVANFTREMRTLASLNHPKLVGAIDSGEDAGVYYLATEYMAGTNLRRLIRTIGPLNAASAASIICQVAEGLAYAHAQGIVHRDVKPANILVTPEGEAKLLDLGLAGSLSGQGEADPRYGKIVGTADYLSPDQISNPRNPTPAGTSIRSVARCILR